ncbi:hypothetical protein PsYK624_070970 [Phanerochaete sordida]|uniref:Uncharacterized protein n=1 Tax=Phanerochaete sordida TaxID=48140 RepID=A0A9P3GAE6_9APHY|nr:hypothetical protein PsYK624_070970 [Phanerochaete sordida]
MTLPHHPAHEPAAPASIPTENAFVAFPSGGDEPAAPPAPEYWNGRAPRPLRTVRRKKSSFDLRHVFKTGGAVPHAPAGAVAML